MELGLAHVFVLKASLSVSFLSLDYSRKRIRSVKKLMRVGKQEVLQVLRVDEEKGYVDLSKKLLMPKDIEECSERYEKSKIVNGILRRLAETRNENVSVPYEAFGWAMFEGDEGHAFDVLQSSLLDGVTPSIMVFSAFA